MAIRGKYGADGTVTLFDTVTGTNVLTIAPDGTVNVVTAGKLQVGSTALTATAAQMNLLAQGVAAGYKVARGVHTQVAAVDTVATGLATVVAVVVSWALAPTAKQTFVIGGIGNQSGAPVAGSILISTFKSTYAVADDFTDALASSWIAVGT